jgi:ring-1,2-phenylacetyl-CoA epoxidase subunit PaaC
MSNEDIKNNLIEYCTRIGDTSLIQGHRLGEWCGHAPILEEDIAITNMALDYIGQSKIILNYAGELEGKDRDCDDLAYKRDAREFKNFLITEQPNGDFAMTIIKQFLISAYNFTLYSNLTKSKDENLAAFASKSVKEIAYHLRHNGDWVVRLGDGTEESHQRIQNAVNDIWLFVDDLFDVDDVDQFMADHNYGPDPALIKKEWYEIVNSRFSEAKLEIPEVNNFLRVGSRQGNHTEHLGFLLAEMQFLPRAYPDATW